MINIKIPLLILKYQWQLDNKMPVMRSPAKKKCCFWLHYTVYVEVKLTLLRCTYTTPKQGSTIFPLYVMFFPAEKQLGSPWDSVTTTDNT